MTQTNPAFNIANLNAAALSQVQIQDSSEGLSFGRRFKMVDKDGLTSEAMLFRDIIDDVKKVAKQAKEDGDLKKLEAVEVLLGRLSQADMDAEVTYAEKGGIYHFLTNVSRLFRASHTDRIKGLKGYVSTQMTDLNPFNRFNNLKGTENIFVLGDLAQGLFEIGDYDRCVETIKKISPIHAKETNLLVKIADSYISTDPDKALETIKLATKKDDRTDAVVNKLASEYYVTDNLDKALEVIQEARTQTKEDFIGKVAEKYFIAKEYKKVVDTIELVSSNITLKNHFIKRILDVYIANGEYEKAFDLLPEYRSRKTDYALDLAEKFCANNDYENARKAIEFVTQEDSLGGVRLRYMAIMGQVVKGLCESDTPEKALDLVKPIKVGNIKLEYSPKNDLSKRILEAYIAQGRLDEAFTIIDQDTNEEVLRQDFRMDNELLMSIAAAYHAKGDKAKALATLNSCNGMHYITEIQQLKNLYNQ